MKRLRCLVNSMRSGTMLCWLIGVLVVARSWGSPIVPYQSEALPLPLVPELSSRLSNISNRLQESRLPLPTPQDLEAIKKVAQILVMLGEQVIPTIIGEPPACNCDHTLNEDDVSNDPVNEKQLPQLNM